MESTPFKGTQVCVAHVSCFGYMTMNPLRKQLQVVQAISGSLEIYFKNQGCPEGN